MRARADGAVERAGLALELRPCEPLDVFLVVDRLRRSGRLRESHVKVLFAYGAQLCPPPEYKSYDLELWRQALGALSHALRAKGIVT